MMPRTYPCFSRIAAFVPPPAADEQNLALFAADLQMPWETTVEHRSAEPPNT